ncbi:MAG: insulinase family protein [Chloracidobacterium sp.]|nr:insulinase family protein [Chloracidobacterium sp.]
MNLREEKGYTYGAYTRLNTRRLAGDIEATAEVRNDVTGASLKEFFYELERIRDEKVGDEELADAKNFLTGVFPLRAETQEGLTNLIVNQHLYGLPEDYLQTYRDNVSAVTADDVQRVAIKYVRPDEMAIVIVGDAGDVLPQAKDYAATVEIFDTEGSRNKNCHETLKYTKREDHFDFRDFRVFRGQIAYIGSVNWMIAKSAPDGSATIAILPTPGASNGGTRTLPHFR